MNDPFRIIRTFLTSADAELARGALEAAGIDAITRADDSGGIRRLNGIALLVRDEDAARADEVLGTESVMVDRPDDGDPGSERLPPSPRLRRTPVASAEAGQADRDPTDE
jgi:hypothetical protein